MGRRSDGTFEPGTLAFGGFDLSRITIVQASFSVTPGRKLSRDWLVWFPPTGPKSYEGEDVELGAYVDYFGETYWGSWQEACNFVSLVLNKKDTT